MKRNVIRAFVFLLVLPVVATLFLLFGQFQLATYCIYLSPFWGLLVLVNFIRTNGFV